MMKNTTPSHNNQFRMKSLGTHSRAKPEPLSKEDHTHSGAPLPGVAEPFNVSTQDVIDYLILFSRLEPRSACF